MPQVYKDYLLNPGCKYKKLFFIFVDYTLTLGLYSLTMMYLVLVNDLFDMTDLWQIEDLLRFVDKYENLCLVLIFGP